MWHYVPQGLYLKASAHDTETNEQKWKNVHNIIKILFSELCHKKKIGSKWQGAVKISCSRCVWSHENNSYPEGHYLKVQKKYDFSNNLVHSSKNQRKTTCNKLAGILASFLLQFVLVGCNAVFDCYINNRFTSTDCSKGVLWLPSTEAECTMETQLLCDWWRIIHGWRLVKNWKTW
jgi:hypothetical protein